MRILYAPGVEPLAPLPCWAIEAMKDGLTDLVASLPKGEPGRPKPLYAVQRVQLVTVPADHINSKAGAKRAYKRASMVSEYIRLISRGPTERGYVHRVVRAAWGGNGNLLLDPDDYEWHAAWDEVYPDEPLPVWLAFHPAFLSGVQATEERVRTGKTKRAQADEMNACTTTLALREFKAYMQAYSKGQPWYVDDRVRWSPEYVWEGPTSPRSRAARLPARTLTTKADRPNARSRRLPEYAWEGPITPQSSLSYLDMLPELERRAVQADLLPSRDADGKTTKRDGLEVLPHYDTQESDGHAKARRAGFTFPRKTGKATVDAVCSSLQAYLDNPAPRAARTPPVKPCQIALNALIFLNYGASIWVRPAAAIRLGCGGR